MRNRTTTATRRTAFAIWDERIAPVFDVSRRLHVVDTAGGQIVRESRLEIPPGDDPTSRCRLLLEADIGTLVCGAISRPLLTQVEAHGIDVVPFIAGELNPVVQAWLEETLHEDRYAMPGCCGRRRRRRRGAGQGCGGTKIRKP